MSELPRYLKIGRTDNVAVALADLAAGESPAVDGAAVTLREPVGRGHKFALRRQIRHADRARDSRHSSRELRSHP